MGQNMGQGNMGNMNQGNMGQNQGMAGQQTPASALVAQLQRQMPNNQNQMNNQGMMGQQQQQNYPQQPF